MIPNYKAPDPVDVQRWTDEFNRDVDLQLEFNHDLSYYLTFKECWAAIWAAEYASLKALQQEFASAENYVALKASEQADARRQARREARRQPRATA